MAEKINRHLKPNNTEKSEQEGKLYCHCLYTETQSRQYYTQEQDKRLYHYFQMEG